MDGPWIDVKLCVYEKLRLLQLLSFRCQHLVNSTLAFIRSWHVCTIYVLCFRLRPPCLTSFWIFDKFQYFCASWSECWFLKLKLNKNDSVSNCAKPSCLIWVKYVFAVNNTVGKVIWIIYHITFPAVFTRSKLYKVRVLLDESLTVLKYPSNKVQALHKQGQYIWKRESLVRAS